MRCSYATFSLTLMIASGASAAPLMLRASTLPTGASPESATIADVNADGRLDLLTANSGAGTLTIYYAEGAGFASPVTLSVGAGAFEARVADLNSDGLPDLVVARIGGFGGGGDVVVRLATAPGVFAPASVIATGDTPVAIDVADLNGDGRLDIVAADSGFGGGGDELLVMLASPLGGFEPAQRLATGDYPSDVLIADMNTDSIPDLVVSNASSGTTGILFGLVSGGFSAMEAYPVGPGPRGVAAADLNLDGSLDLATANGIGTSSASVLVTQGTVFAPEQRLAVGAFPTSVALVDVNGDGLADVVTANRSSADVSVRTGNPDGSFNALMSFPAGVGANFVVAGDLDDDGRADLAIANVGDATLTILMGATPDYTGDGVVDTLDLAFLLAAWGDANADLSGDATTNADDLALLLNAWGDA